MEHAFKLARRDVWPAWAIPSALFVQITTTTWVTIHACCVPMLRLAKPVLLGCAPHVPKDIFSTRNSAVSLVNLSVKYVSQATNAILFSTQRDIPSLMSRRLPTLLPLVVFHAQVVQVQTHKFVWTAFLDSFSLTPAIVLLVSPQVCVLSVPQATLPSAWVVLLITFSTNQCVSLALFLVLLALARTWLSV